VLPAKHMSWPFMHAGRNIALSRQQENSSVVVPQAPTMQQMIEGEL